MPHLDATALTQDPEGCAFLSEILATDEPAARPSWGLKPSLPLKLAASSVTLEPSTMTAAEDLAFA